MPAERPMVLFLCTGNSARSQMAEALLRHRAGDRFEVHSAGLEPKSVHPLTLKVLQERGLETSGLQSKGLSGYLGKVAVRHAIVVCEHAQQNCPRLFPFSTRTHYWPFEDPAAFEGAEDERLRKFREVLELIDQRIGRWLSSEEQQ